MKYFSAGWSEGYDGPGRRWVVYLKGCNYRCRWCANPESISVDSEMLFHAEHSQLASRACARGAVMEKLDESGMKTGLDRMKCRSCLDRPCIRIWHHAAFEYAGEDASVDEIVHQALERRPLFHPDGGVTFGGGEPGMQAKEVIQAVRLLRREGVHVAVETNMGSLEARQFIDEFDLILADFKCFSKDLHRQWTGVSNETNLESLRLLAANKGRLRIRIPLVTGFNDGQQEQDRMTEFLSHLMRLRGSLDIEIMRLHHLGEPKYTALGLAYPMAGVPSPEREAALNWIGKLRAIGMDARLAG